MVRLQSASREKSEIQSAVPLNAYCFCTIEKLKTCKLSHRINWGPSAYILRKIQRHDSDYPDANTVTISLHFLPISVFCARVSCSGCRAGVELSTLVSFYTLYLSSYHRVSAELRLSIHTNKAHARLCIYTRAYLDFNKLQRGRLVLHDKLYREPNKHQDHNLQPVLAPPEVSEFSVFIPTQKITRKGLSLFL